MSSGNCFVHGLASLRPCSLPTQTGTLSIDARRSRYLARPRPQVRCLHPRVRMTHPAHPGARPFFLKRAARGRESNHNNAEELDDLCGRRRRPPQRAADRSSSPRAAGGRQHGQPSKAGLDGSIGRRRAACSRCIAWHSCIVAAAKRMSAALGRARSAPLHCAWHACMLDLSHTTGTYFPSHLVVLYGCQCHRGLCSCW